MRTSAYLLTMILLSGCAAELPQVQRSDRIVEPRYVSYPTFWENLTHQLRTDTLLSDDYRPLAQAVHHVMAGNHEEALRWSHEAALSADSVTKSHGEKLRDAMFLLRSQWKELVESGDSVLGDGYSRLDTEEYDFSDSTFECPIDLASSGSPIVDVEVNGVSKRFWLDTGAGLSVVSSKTAVECGIVPLVAETGEAGTATTKKVGFQTGEIERLSIGGGLVIRHHPVLIIDQKDLEFKLFGLFTLLKIEGIIGWNAIQNLDLTVDYKNRRLLIRKPSDTPVQNRHLVWLNYPIITMQGPDGVRMLFGLDTGAQRSSITRDILTKLADTSHSERNVRVGSAGGVDKLRSIEIPNLELFGFDHSIRFRKITSLPGDQALFVRLDGVLGSDIFQHGWIRIDFRNGRFTYNE